MTKWKFVLQIIIIALIVNVAISSAQENGDGNIYGLITVNSAEVRVGPDFAYNSVGRLPLNASVQILGRSGDFFSRWDGRQWLHIQWAGGSGWVYARLVRTSSAFNSIPPTGRQPPRDNNGRIPPGFNLSSEICTQWQGGYTQSGNFMGGDEIITVTYPTLQGANIYSVIVIAPDGFRTAFDSETGVAEIKMQRLPYQEGTYTWRVAPYWTNSTSRYRWQQVCLLRTGGTFEKPDTTPQQRD